MLLCECMRWYGVLAPISRCCESKLEALESCSLCAGTRHHLLCVGNAMKPWQSKSVCVVVMCGGVGFAVINAQLDSVMSRKLRLSTVPAVVAVVNGKLQWFDRHFSVQHLRDFVRGLHPQDLIQEVMCLEDERGNYQNCFVLCCV